MLKYRNSPAHRWRQFCVERTDIIQKTATLLLPSAIIVYPPAVLFSLTTTLTVKNSVKPLMKLSITLFYQTIILANGSAH